MNRIDIGLRGVCLRSSDEGDGRTLEGIAVPFGQIIDTWDGPETVSYTHLRAHET